MQLLFGVCRNPPPPCLGRYWTVQRCRHGARPASFPDALGLSRPHQLWLLGKPCWPVRPVWPWPRRLCKGGRVLTVFTTSAYCGGSNGAGAAYVAQGIVRMISVTLNTTKSRCGTARWWVAGGGLLVVAPGWRG